MEVPKTRLLLILNGLDIRFTGGVTVACPELAEWEPMFSTSNGMNERNHSPAIWNASSIEVVDPITGEISYRPAGMHPIYNVPEFTLKPGESRIFSVSNGTIARINKKSIYTYLTMDEGFTAADPNSWTGFAVKVDPKIGSADGSSRLRGVSLTGSKLELRFGFGTSGVYQSGFTGTLVPRSSGKS